MGGLRYRGQLIGLATMHGKERAIAKPFLRYLDAGLVVPDGIDTDALGTFTGEVARAGSITDAARRKAELAMKMTGLCFGLGSEGSFGPHPFLPFISADTEALLFIDRASGSEIIESIVTPRTNYRYETWAADQLNEEFLEAVGFPAHALVVKPQGVAHSTLFFKGISSRRSLRKAVKFAASTSPDGQALITTDMRAHLNPTRMKVIRLLASRLARRLATDCPQCATPGYGEIEICRGLPCGWCYEPTDELMGKRIRCRACGYTKYEPLKNAPNFADPGRCASCNP